MADLPDNFKDYPVSLQEAKAHNASRSDEWTPRDMLIAALRDIDAGKLDPKEAFLIMATGDTPDDFTHTWRASSGSNIHVGVGLIMTALFNMLASRNFD